ncbi:MAG: hypothetical protein WA851_24695 [Xanthobacteraceae bacterium]
MSNSNEGRSNTELWSVQQAASWIQSRTHAKSQAFVEIVATNVEELHNALKTGEIIGTGCVDGGERRTISGEEWHDYSLKLHYAAFMAAHFTGSLGTPVIDVLSVRSFPAAALKYHGYPSGIRIPSAHSNESEVGYHRVITDVMLPRRQIIQRWPQGRDDHLITEPALQPDIGGRRRNRERPTRARAQRAINEIYSSGVPDPATEPNTLLCRKVGRWLKDKGLPDASDETILRAAGRRK